MPDVAQEAMEALLVLHHPDKIEMWNPEAPINTFWDVSSQVTEHIRNIVKSVLRDKKRTAMFRQLS